MPTPAHRIPVTVLAGQSNATGLALAAQIFHATAAAGGMMVHVAMNGSALAATAGTDAGHWNAPDARHAMGENLALLFAQLASILDPASPSHVPGAYLDNVIWVQGEADACTGAAARAYGANLRAFHAALTARFGAHDLIVSGLSDVPADNGSFSDSHVANWQIIQRHQREVAAGLPTIHVVNPDTLAAHAGLSADDMFRADLLHYNNSFASQLGRALSAAAFADHQAAQNPVSAARIGTRGNDVFHLSLTPFAQVFAGPGHDRAILTAALDLAVIEATATSTRIIAMPNGQTRMLDLIGVEALWLGAGNDTIHLAGGVAYLHSGAGNDSVQGGARSESLALGPGQDRAQGGGSRDILLGGTGDDALWGQTGNDWLRGGAGQDHLFGGSGRDRLAGGPGADVLQGGTGADWFVFSPASGQDRITDFDPHTDHLLFRGLALHDLTLRQIGDDLVITTATTRLVIADTLLADLPRADILFL
jgi:RTX calcium-binding nonapeptide repeat (4 copies)/Carbohydrate esterase, sialic acid-specific acetylesterase